MSDNALLIIVVVALLMAFIALIAAVMHSNHLNAKYGNEDDKEED